LSKSIIVVPGREIVFKDVNTLSLKWIKGLPSRVNSYKFGKLNALNYLILLLPKCNPLIFEDPYFPIVIVRSLKFKLFKVRTLLVSKSWFFFII
jgi:hypothetical protein